MILSDSPAFTIVETLIVVSVIGILSTLSIIYIPNIQSEARDNERQSDIDSLHGRLEEYFQDKGAYPSTFDSSTFPRTDNEILKAPNQTSILITAPASDEAAARSGMAPTIEGPQYIYTAYPSGCTNNCVGYILKTIIERPSSSTPNPYIKGGLHNN